MSDVFGLDADVFFGDTYQPLPDWRKDATEEDEDTIQPGVKSMLGFDPAELDEPDRFSADPEDGERHRLDVPDAPLNDAPPIGEDLAGMLSAAFQRRGW